MTKRKPHSTARARVTIGPPVLMTDASLVQQLSRAGLSLLRALQTGADVSTAGQTLAAIIVRAAGRVKEIEDTE